MGRIMEQVIGLITGGAEGAGDAQDPSRTIASEAQLCVGEDVIVVGGGNSAGQAAVFLAETATRVHMLVRGKGLADTMSRYLIRRIEDNPAIELRTRTQIIGLEGDRHVERVCWRDDRTAEGTREISGTCS